MSKYLDSNGLLYFWGKLKTLFAGKVDKVEGKGLSTNDYTSAEKTKLSGIANNANNYTLPIATASALGGVKVGSNLTITDGVLSAVQGSYSLPTASASTKGGVKIGSNLTIEGDVLSATDTTYNDATTSAHGLMTAADKTKLDGFGQASTYALKSDITGVYTYQGSVATYAALPSTGVSIGDVYNVETNGQNYAWTGSAWDSLGETFQISDISNSDIDTIMAT